MSKEDEKKKDPYYYDHHFDPPYGADFDPSSVVGFSDFLHDYNFNFFSAALDMSCSSSEVISPVDDASKKSSGVGAEWAVTGEHPSSSCSSDDRVAAGGGGGGDSAKSGDQVVTKEFEDKDGEKCKKKV